MFSSPPTALATTGMPHAAASRATSPKLSLRLGHDHHVGCAVVAGQDVVRLRRDEPHPVGDAEVGDQLPASASLVAVDAAGATDDHQHGVAAGRAGQGADRHVGRLERLDPPDEQQHRAVGGQAERAPGAAPVAGGEEGVLDGRRDDLDAPGGVAVQPRNWRSSSGQLTQIASLQPMTSASARSRHAGSRSPPSALTRASVWNVETSGTSRACLRRWPTTPLSQ